MTDLGKERKRRVVKKIWFESEKVELHLSVYLGVLPILKEYVMVFQVIKDFLEKVIKAYVACGKYMQVKLPLKSKTLQALSSIDPVVRGHSEAGTQLRQLAGIMKHLVPQESDITQEIIRYNVDSTLAQYREGDNMVMWWAHLMSTGKYPALSGVIRGAVSIFHGPMVESSFNLMGDIIDSKSANMNISTFDAIQTAKYYMKSRGMTATMMFKREEEKFGPVDRKLCQNMRAAGGRDKAQRAERLLERRRRQVEYGCSKTCGSAQNKRTVQEEEKEERLRHAAKQRNAARRRALEILQGKAKKMKKC
ncbi:hypothetical protein AAFF_G00344980 [Aldrovandia affinis]|uniref:HAT C-terminal dimerisation domain-containing protein n=1 Tax=Aldrovandia affinis TaxID=143900 RepID=A0AAD7R6D5_9TELE|nr:hypothetical protein AAFF_G00344980 [Aldrovandia affinis]